MPGPSAVVAALVTSGLPTGRFVFEGFLPRKGSGRTGRLAAVAAEERTTVLYEAPHRVARTLADLAAACGDDRRVAVARELTKLHEEVWRGTLAEAVTWAAATPPKGELVLTLDGATAPRRPTTRWRRPSAGHWPTGRRPGTRPPRWPPPSTSRASGPTASPSASTDPVRAFSGRGLAS